MTFKRVFETTVGIEGRYSNNPADPGGETMYGITVAVARAFGYAGPMSELPIDLAQEIYRVKYWNELSLESVNTLSASIAEELFDTAVNCGVSFAAMSLHRSLNALNREQADFKDFAANAPVSADTVASLGTYLLKRKLPGERVLLKVLNCLQGARYMDIVERRPASETFLYGWFLNRVDLP